MAKLSELEEKDQEAVNDTLSSAAAQIGGDMWDAPCQARTVGYGLCSKCAHFKFAATEFDVRFAYCSQEYHKPMALSTREPIRECSQYDERGRLNLNEMASIATLIDPENVKEQIGFRQRKEDDK